MTFVRRVFLFASLYGVAALLPQYFLEARLGRDFPPPITHPEHFYGFIGLALVWQGAFFLVSRDPIRYRPLMPVAVLEKLSFGGATVVLFALGRIAVPVLAVGLVDLALAVLFTLAFFRTPGNPPDIRHPAG
jgi:hypothetical protein